MNLQSLHSMMLLIFPSLYSKISDKNSEFSEISAASSLLIPFYVIFKENH